VNAPVALAASEAGEKLTALPSYRRVIAEPEVKPFPVSCTEPPTTATVGDKPIEGTTLNEVEFRFP